MNTAFSYEVGSSWTKQSDEELASEVRLCLERAANLVRELRKRGFIGWDKESQEELDSEDPFRTGIEFRKTETKTI